MNIEGLIEVYDNFLNNEEIEQLYDVFWKEDWNMDGNDSKYISRDSQAWSLSRVIKPEDKNFSYYRGLSDRILSLDFFSNKFILHRILINAYKFGDVLRVHYDSGYSITAIIYGNNKWEINWGSETIFASSQTKDADIIASIIPKPGRMVFFDSNIPHTGRPPSSLFPNWRYGVVFNFIKK